MARRDHCGEDPWQDATGIPSTRKHNQNGERNYEHGLEGMTIKGKVVARENPVVSRAHDDSSSNRVC